MTVAKMICGMVDNGTTARGAMSVAVKTRVGRVAVLLAWPALLLGCATPAEQAGPVVQRTVDGNTTIVENLAGSVWGAPAELIEDAAIGVLEGEDPYMLGQVASVAGADDRIYVLDASLPVVRIYDGSGTYVGDAGRNGQGPGEYERPTGLAIDREGRLLVADISLRVLVYDRDGGHLDTWRWEASGRSFRQPTILPRDGGAWVADFLLPEEGRRAGIVSGYRAVGPEGPVEQLRFLPILASDAPAATVGRTRFTGLIPFISRPLVAMGPDGAFYSRTGTEYRFKIEASDGTSMVVTRHWQPVRVAGEEGEAYLAWAESRIRRMAEQPEWRWNGPDIPAVKAAFNDLVPDANGDRVWVAREGPGRQIPGCDLDQALEAGKMICWRSEVFWDVFAHDGTYLGEVAAPDGAFLRTSHIDGNRVITTVIDDEGLVRVLRLRLQAPDAS